MHVDAFLIAIPMVRAYYIAVSRLQPLDEFPNVYQSRVGLSRKVAENVMINGGVEIIQPVHKCSHVYLHR